MSTYRFTDAERYAVFAVHGEKCYLCRTPVALTVAEVDHIIPERLEGTAELTAVLLELGRPSSFQIDSYENWMPSHRECNRRKAGRVFEPSLALQTELQIAKEKAPRARELADRFASDRRIAVAIQELKVAAERGVLSDTHLSTIRDLFAVHDSNRAPPERGQPLFLTPLLEIVSDAGGMLVLKGPGGHVGMRPKAATDHSWDCPRCGETGWNGARCIICGYMDDGY